VIAPTFTALVGDLRTGKITTRLPLTGCSWQQVMNGAGTITGATVDVQAASLATLDLYHAAAPGKAFLAIQYDQSLLNAGPIWTHHYTRSTGTLTMGAAGLWSLFDHRFVIPLLSEPLAVGAAQAAVTTYPTGSNLSLGDIAAALVTQAQTHVGGNLPLVMPAAQGLTPGATRTYAGYSLSAVGAMLTELTGVVGGPEVAFRPRIKTTDPTRIEWVMLAGTPAQPWLVQGGLDWVFDASVPQSMVSDIDVDVDATGMGTRAWEIGSGSQNLILMSQADSTVLTSAGYPLLEVQDSSHNNVLDQPTLDGYSAQLLAQTGRPDTLWKVTVRDDGAPADGSPSGIGGPRLGQYQAGDFCQIVVGADPYLAAGTRRARILAIDGDLGFNSTLTLATMAAEV
jgi:hypothetical protein